MSSASNLPRHLESCEKIGKISCRINGVTVCMDENLECDGHPNCGNSRQFDENVNICRVVQKKKWYIVLCSVCLASFILYMLYRLASKLFIVPIATDFFVLKEGKGKLQIKPQLNPPQVQTFRDNIKEHLDVYSSNEQSVEPLSLDVKAEGLVTDSIQSSTETDWNLSTATTTEDVKPRKVRKRKWPEFSRAEMPQYEKQFSDKMKMRMLSSTSEDEKPKITFYAATTKLS